MWTITGPPNDEAALKLEMHPATWEVDAAGTASFSTTGPGGPYKEQWSGSGKGHKQGNLMFSRPPDDLTLLIVHNPVLSMRLANAMHLKQVMNNNGDVQTFTDSHDLVEWLKPLEIHLTSEGQRSIKGSRSLAADTHTPFPILDPGIADATTTVTWALTWSRP
jgi:hypothetical protein